MSDKRLRVRVRCILMITWCKALRIYFFSTSFLRFRLANRSCARRFSWNCVPPCRAKKIIHSWCWNIYSYLIVSIHNPVQDSYNRMLLQDKVPCHKDSSFQSVATYSCWCGAASGGTGNGFSGSASCCFPRFVSAGDSLLTFCLLLASFWNWAALHGSEVVPVTH